MFQIHYPVSALLPAEELGFSGLARVGHARISAEAGMTTVAPTYVPSLC